MKRTTVSISIFFGREKADLSLAEVRALAEAQTRGGQIARILANSPFIHSKEFWDGWVTAWNENTRSVENFSATQILKLVEESRQGLRARC